MSCDVIFIYNPKGTSKKSVFLAVQDSSIGDLVTQSVSESVSQVLISEMQLTIETNTTVVKVRNTLDAEIKSLTHSLTY